MLELISYLMKTHKTVSGEYKLIPKGFRKTLKFDDREVVFEFPNEDTSGTHS